MNQEQYKIAREEKITLAEYIRVLQSSELAERRPYAADNRKTQEILNKSNLFVTTRDKNGELVGFSRSITDGFVCYMSDLAVDKKYQGQGVGKSILRETYNAAGCKIVLRTAPTAREFYEAVGCAAIDNGYEYRP